MIQRFAAVLPAFLLSLPVAHAQTGRLAMKVEARSAEVTRLRTEFDTRLAAFEKTPAFNKVVEIKSKFSEQVWHGDPSIRDWLLKEAQQTITNTLEGNADWQRLAALKDDLARTNQSMTATGEQMQQLTEAIGQQQNLDARLAKLRQTEKQLRERITQLRGVVAAQKDANTKAYNQGLLDRALCLVDDMGRQIKDIEGQLANGQLRAQDLTGSTAQSEADKIQQQWQRTMNRRDDVANMLSSLIDIGTQVKLEVNGQISVRKMNGQELTLDKGSNALMQPGDSIQTGPKSSVMMTLPDGSKLTLGANTTFTFDGKEKVPCGDLKQGMIRILEAMGARPKKIRTPTAVCAVRGTDFIVEVADGETRFLVASGAVEITPEDATNATLVRAGQAYAIRSGEVGRLRAMTTEEFERKIGQR